MRDDDALFVDDVDTPGTAHDIGDLRYHGRHHPSIHLGEHRTGEFSVCVLDPNTKVEERTAALHENLSDVDTAFPNCLERGRIRPRAEVIVGTDKEPVLPCDFFTIRIDNGNIGEVLAPEHDIFKNAFRNVGFYGKFRLVERRDVIQYP